MNDLISRQAAIDAIERLQMPIMRLQDNAEQFKFTGMAEAREAIIGLPSVQPEERTEERTETHSCDCISRQGVKEWLNKWEGYIDRDIIARMQYRVIDIPSAQPEVIRCKDCKNSEHWYKDRRRCFLWSEDGVSVWDSGYCNYAERKTDEPDDIFK